MDKLKRLGLIKKGLKAQGLSKANGLPKAPPESPAPPKAEKKKKEAVECEHGCEACPLKLAQPAGLSAEESAKWASRRALLEEVLAVVAGLGRRKGWAVEASAGLRAFAMVELQSLWALLRPVHEGEWGGEWTGDGDHVWGGPRCAQEWPTPPAGGLAMREELAETILRLELVGAVGWRDFKDFHLRFAARLHRFSGEAAAGPQRFPILCRNFLRKAACLVAVHLRRLSPASLRARLPRDADARLPDLQRKRPIRSVSRRPSRLTRHRSHTDGDEDEEEEEEDCDRSESHDSKTSKTSRHSKDSKESQRSARSEDSGRSDASKDSRRSQDSKASDASKHSATHSDAD